jgi:hypothetical protein
LSSGIPVVLRTPKPTDLKANFWNGKALASHHCVTCGRERRVSVSPVGALSTTMRS